MKLCNLKGLKDGAVRILSKSGLVLKKYSPEILLVFGAAGTIVGVIMACKATPKATEEYYEFLDDAAELHAKEEKDIRDTVRVYSKAGLRYLKVYGPAAAVIFASIGCNIGSYAILHNRGAALAAALATTTAAFEEYRRNVVNKFGEDAEAEVRFGIREASVDDCTTLEDAVETEAGDLKYCVNPTGFDRCFDEYNPMWTKSAIDNLNYLVQCQAAANEKLRRQGHLFVNELYDICHFPRVKEGQVEGWIYDPNRTDLHNFIDLGLYSIKDVPHDNFLRGLETNVWLRITPDGDILSLMK